jgi:hypothetical protein
MAVGEVLTDLRFIAAFVGFLVIVMPYVINKTLPNNATQKDLKPLKDDIKDIIRKREETLGLVPKWQSETVDTVKIYIDGRLKDINYDFENKIRDRDYVMKEFASDLKSIKETLSEFQKSFKAILKEIGTVKEDYALVNIKLSDIVPSYKKLRDNKKNQ